MNRLISWSRYKLNGKKADSIEDKTDVVDGVTTKGKGKEVCKQAEPGKQEKVLMIQWKDDETADKCLSHVSDDSAFSSSGCIVHDPSLQLDSDSSKGGHHLNCSLDQDDLSDEELQQHNIHLSVPADNLKKDADENSFTSLQYQATSSLHSQLLPTSIHHGHSMSNSLNEKPELVRSTSVEGKKEGFRARLRRISRLGLDRNIIDQSLQLTSDHSVSSQELDSLDIWVSSSFSPKIDSMIEVVRVDPFMKARILSFSGSVSSPLPSSSPPSVAILQTCSKNKDMAFEKEFQKCLKKGSIKKAGKRSKYCFLFESFLLLTKQKFPSIFQLKHVVTLKLLWISLQANADIDDDASDEDNDRVLFKQSTESSGGNEKEEEREDKLDGTYYSDEQRTSEKETPQSLLSVPVLPNGENPEGRSNTNDGNSTNTCNSLSVTADDNVANNTNFSNITNESNTSNKLSATLGWIHEKVHMKNVTFRSESERKEWMNALKKQQEEVCRSMEKSLIIKVQCYDKQLGTRTKKLEVVRNDTMKEVLAKFPKSGISFMSGNLSDCSFGVKFVDSVEKNYLKGSESLFVLQLASDKGLLNGHIECFTISQARVSSISKQINSRRRRLKRTSRLELCEDFLAFHYSKAPSSKHRLFGCNLQDFCSDNDNKLPTVILALLNKLHEQGPQAEGIFRKSHNQRDLKDKVSRFNSLRESFDQHELEDVSVHMAAALVKYWLMKLKDCLLMSRLYFKWLEIGRMRETNKQIEKYQKLAKKLPSCHLLLLKYLMCVLHHISSASSSNLMSSRNLAVCLGPSILKPSSFVDMNQEKNSVETANDVVDTLIRETDAIFGKVERIEIFGEAEVLPEDDWMDKRSGEGEIVKVQSCENLDCGGTHLGEENARFRACSFDMSVHFSHAPLSKVLSSPGSSIKDISKDLSPPKSPSDVNIAQTFRDRYFLYTDTTNTDESVSEDSYSHGSMMVNDSIVQNFVKKTPDQNEDVDNKGELEDLKLPPSGDEIDGEVQSEEVKTPKAPSAENKFEKFSEEAPEADSKETKDEGEPKKRENKEEQFILKDGSISSDSDTLTKGSCIVSSVNSPAVASSIYTFDYPPSSVHKKSRSKSIPKNNKNLKVQEKTKNLALHFEKRLKENSSKHSSMKIHPSSEQTPSIVSLKQTKPAMNSELTKSKSKLSKSLISLPSESPKTQSHRNSPQLSDVVNDKIVIKQNAYINDSTEATKAETKSSLVELQIQKYEESERLLYESLRRQRELNPATQPTTSTKSSARKPVLKHTFSDPFSVPQKYIVEVKVGNLEQKVPDVKSSINRPIIANAPASLVSKAYKHRYNDITRQSSLSSQFHPTDTTFHNQPSPTLSLVSANYHNRRSAHSQNRILQSFSNDHSSTKYFYRPRSKTPTLQKTFYTSKSPVYGTDPKTRQRLNDRYRTELYLPQDRPVKSETFKKPFVTSVYLNSDFDSDINSIAKDRFKSNFQKFNKTQKPTIYRSTFTLNF